MTPSWSLFWFFVASGLAVNLITYIFRAIDHVLARLLP